LREGDDNWRKSVLQDWRTGGEARIFRSEERLFCEEKRSEEFEGKNLLRVLEETN
jgi:hypothetical protein